MGCYPGLIICLCKGNKLMTSSDLQPFWSWMTVNQSALHKMLQFPPSHVQLKIPNHVGNEEKPSGHTSIHPKVCNGALIYTLLFDSLEFTQAKFSSWRKHAGIYDGFWWVTGQILIKKRRLDAAEVFWASTKRNIFPSCVLFLREDRSKALFWALYVPSCPDSHIYRHRPGLGRGCPAAMTHPNLPPVWASFGKLGMLTTEQQAS